MKSSKRHSSLATSHRFFLEPGWSITESHHGQIKTTEASSPSVTRYKVVSYEIVVSLSNEDSRCFSYKAIRRESGSNKKSFVFIKTPRIPKGTPDSEILSLLRDVSNSFEQEFRRRERISQLNKSKSKVAAEIITRSHFEQDNYLIPFLVLEFIDEPNMEVFFKDATNASQPFSGMTRPSHWFQLARSVTDIVRRMHNRLIVHGELFPKNILLSSHGRGVISPIIVDFGNSLQLDIANYKTSALQKASPYLAPECWERSHGWHTPADIYSLGGVLYFLATGSPPPSMSDYKEIFASSGAWLDLSREKVDEWKRVIHKGFKNNSGLMEKHESIVKVIDKCLRPAPTDRYSSAEKVLQALDVVDYETRRAWVSQPLSESLPNKLTRVEKKIPKKKEFNPVFAQIVHDKVAMLDKELDDMRRGHFEIFGEREDIIDSLVKYISILEAGDVYLTATVPDYWTEHNLGVNGRFLTVNKDLARNGVFVNRIFLLTQQDLATNTRSKSILNAHLDAWHDLGTHLKLTQPRLEQEEDTLNGGMFVGGIIMKDTTEVKQAQERLEHVAIWQRRRTGEMMSIIFISRPVYEPIRGHTVETGGQIVKVRFRVLKDKQPYESLLRYFIGEHGTVTTLATLLDESRMHS